MAWSGFGARIKHEAQVLAVSVGACHEYRGIVHLVEQGTAEHRRRRASMDSVAPVIPAQQQRHPDGRIAQVRCPSVSEHALLAERRAPRLIYSCQSA